MSVGLKKGPHSSKVSLKKLKENPHGVDLGALQLQMPEALYQKDQHINLFPKEMKVDWERALDKLKKNKQNDGLLLIGRRQLRTCNTWLHNSPRLIKNNTCDLYIHPEDAAKYQLTDGQQIKVTSKVGSVKVPF